MINNLAKLREAGHALKLDGERILFTAARGTTRDEKQTILEMLRSERQELIVALVAEERYEAPASALAACGSPNCNGCYEVGPNVHIHPPKGEYNYERK